MKQEATMITQAARNRIMSGEGQGQYTEDCEEREGDSMGLDGCLDL